MPKHEDTFGIFDSDGKFRRYLFNRAAHFDGLHCWEMKSEAALQCRPIRSGDLVFFHATRQLSLLDKSELITKSESGEFTPGFYTTSGTDLNDSLKLGWYWYECKKKTKTPKLDWHIIQFVLRREYFETYLASHFMRDTCRYYLQEPRRFLNGGQGADNLDIQSIEFANRHGQVMVFPDKKTPIHFSSKADPCSLDEFVFKRQAMEKMCNYAVIVGLQKPGPLDMRQQCWVSPNGLWHINHAERYVVFDRSKQNLANINDFIIKNDS